MAYTKTDWVDNSAPYINSTNLNKIEQGISDAQSTADGHTTLINDNITDISNNSDSIVNLDTRVGDLETTTSNLNFTDLNDTPPTLTADTFLKVNAQGTAIIAGNPDVEEAPLDGQVYSRKDGGWVVVESQLIGNFTPTAGNEYPDPTGVSNGAYWAYLTDGYTYVVGDLVGEEVVNGDYIYYTDAVWVLVKYHDVYNYVVRAETAADEAEAAAILTAADVVITNADVISTNNDVVSTNNDVVSTNNDVLSTNADVVSTNNDVVSTNNDVVSTNNDVLSTNADVVITNADVISTNNDVLSTNADVVTSWNQQKQAEAEKLNSDSYATEPEDVPVKVYTWNTVTQIMDVVDTNPVEYSAFHWKQKAADIAAGGINLTDLGDVTVLNPQVDDIIQYDGAEFINVPLSLEKSLGELSDVNVINVQDNDVLVYDSANTEWIDRNLATHEETLLNKDITNISNHVHADLIHVAIKNTTGAITKGEPLSYDGYDAGEAVIKVKTYDGINCIGIAGKDVAQGVIGGMVQIGVLDGVDTSSFNDGETLYPVPGGFTNARPSIPSESPQAVAVVMTSKIDGTIQINIKNPESGSVYHNELAGRDAIDSHPISAITGLQTALDDAGAGGTLGVLTKTFVLDEEAFVPVSEDVIAPVVGVTYEVPETGLTNSDWDVAVDGTNYDIEDYSLNADITPSATTGDITITLSVGSFTTDHIGMKISGNGGIANLNAIDGSATVTTDFTNTDPILAGNWTMEALIFDANGVKINSAISGTSWNISNTTIISTSAATNPYDMSVSPDGTKLLMMETKVLREYDLGTPYDINTRVDTGNSLSLGRHNFFVSPDGLNLYTSEFAAGTSTLYQGSLGTAFDLSTYSAIRDFTYNTDDSAVTMLALHFSDDGTKMWWGNEHSYKLYYWTLSTAWNISTTTYQYYVGTLGSGYFRMSDNGTKIWRNVGANLVGTNTIFEYSLSTPYDIRTETLIIEKDFGVNIGAFNFIDNGTKVITGSVGDDVVRDFALEGEVYVYGNYYTAITNNIGQINTEFWTDLNSITPIDTAANGGNVFLSLSIDNHASWIIAKHTIGLRNTVRNNAGTWEYNSNTDYALETWTVGTINEEIATIKEAMTIAENRLSYSELAAITDEEQMALGNTFDLCIMLKNIDNTNSPSTDGFTLNYDGNVKHHGAIHGTDYSYIYESENDRLVFKSLKDNNLKIRVV